MTNKIAYYALAVGIAVVMAAGMGIGTAGANLSDNEGAGYGSYDSSYSKESEMAVESAGEIREPLETGALPHESVTEDPEGWVNISAAEQDSSPELRGRPNIQSGGGGE
jgi:hypothetical protein